MIQDQAGDSHSVVKSQKKAAVLLPLLDRLIPLEPVTPDTHPFLHPVEQSELREPKLQRERIWSMYRHMEGQSTDRDAQWGSDDPPILERVEPVVPSSSVNGTPPMPEIKSKKAGRKSLQCMQPPKMLDKFDDDDGGLEEEDGKVVRKSRKAKSRKSAPAELAGLEEVEGNDVTVKALREYKNCFGAFDKAGGYMNGFRVLGKMMDKEGSVNYLVKWDH